MDYLAVTRDVFERAPFMKQLGVEIIEAADGFVVAELELQAWMTQATGVAHAGIVTGVADHTAAAAARLSTGDPDGVFVSIQVATNLVRPAAGPKLRVVGKTVNAGKRVAFASAEVFSISADGSAKLCATFNVSLIDATPAR